jgi:hypothetical protein
VKLRWEAFFLIFSRLGYWAAEMHHMLLEAWWEEKEKRREWIFEGRLL